MTTFVQSFPGAVLVLRHLRALLFLPSFPRKREPSDFGSFDGKALAKYDALNVMMRRHFKPLGSRFRGNDDGGVVGGRVYECRAMRSCLWRPLHQAPGPSSANSKHPQAPTHARTTLDLPPARHRHRKSVV